MSAALRKEWEETSAAAAQRQREICETLSQTASDITTQSQAHNASTIAEIARLVQAASVAPQAAAEVIAELRQKLSDSMVRDTAMLDERNRLLGTLETLLDAVNRASTEQRSAIDALVSTSSDLLVRVGGQFSANVEAETGKLGALAAQVSSSAVEVASLGDAFGAAVTVFGESNDKLVAHLERIESALDKSLARSDDQLAYYVAQAREVIDLSMLSQKQIVENLQQLAGQRAAAGVDAA
ncbi:Methyl-accepting chemotaxis protein [Paraburkholderia unamae]|nr:Methyl-accepting chemotaxis protein [Paraburkholderia unamae]